MRILTVGTWMTALGLAAGLLLVSPAVAQDNTATAPDLSGVKIDGVYGPFLPTDISTHGHEIDSLIGILHWFMGILFVGWGLFFVYCLFRFRQKPDGKAVYQPVKAKASKYVEIGVAVFEAFLLIGLSIPIWASTKQDVVDKDKLENVLEVRVVAEQFAWNFHYAGPDGEYGRTAPKFVDSAVNPMGIDPDDANGEDDIVSGELHIQVDRPVVAHITSKDVIHSFFIPVMRVKQDAIPGMRIPMWFQATQTGTYEIACAQLCGNNHYSMKALLRVDDQATFEAWFAEKSAPPEEFDEDED